MVDIETLKYEIVKRLKPLDPHKIILFGSYAYGKPNEDSDIDLCIIEKNIISKLSKTPPNLMVRSIKTR